MVAEANLEALQSRILSDLCASGSLSAASETPGARSADLSTEEVDELLPPYSPSSPLFDAMINSTSNASNEEADYY